MRVFLSKNWPFWYFACTETEDSLKIRKFTEENTEVMKITEEPGVSKIFTPTIRGVLLADTSVSYEILYASIQKLQ